MGPAISWGGHSALLSSELTVTMAHESVELDVELQKKMEEMKHEKEEEKALKEFKFYHGFLPREDLLFVLKNEGDYLLRVSEVGSGERTVEADLSNKRAIILSVLTEASPGDASVMGPQSAPVKAGYIEPAALDGADMCSLTVHYNAHAY
ncbi:unnamed protein product [Heligmosomoides polygyrus]|uniref:SH2 domain-containing protein n=1 Tax=Heligmosomoides polygyrus TaxID=6339 RepID=A0A3P8FCB1_HELPZ|nr:unnamed protein product [Heligmosomoides polygyrus]